MWDRHCEKRTNDALKPTPVGTAADGIMSVANDPRFGGVSPFGPNVDVRVGR